MAFLSTIGNAGVLWIVIGVVLCVSKKYRRGGMQMLSAELLSFIDVYKRQMLYYHIDDPVIDLKDVTPGTELSEEEINQMILKKLKPDGLIDVYKRQIC